MPRNKSLTWLVDEEHFVKTAELFRILFLAWLLFQTVQMLPYANQTWGAAAYRENSHFDPAQWYSWVTLILFHPAVAPFYGVFVAAQIVALGFGIAGKKLRYAIPAIFFLTTNLNNKAFAYLDGGDNLAQLLLTYLLLINSSGKPIDPKKKFAPFLIGFSNLGTLLCRIQVVLIYFCAGIFKSQGALWQKGMAIYYVLQAEAYSHPFWGPLMTSSPLLTTMATYATLFFQMSFPWCIWSRKTRPYWIAMGTLFHIQIAYVMGLFSFGTMMIVSYVVFFTEAWSASVLGFFSKPPVPMTRRKNGAVALD